jgi:cyclase
MDPGIAEILDNSFQVPLILAGGAGKPEHLLNAIALPYVNAVATANLLNFVGDGLRKTRESIVNSGVELAQWG